MSSSTFIVFGKEWEVEEFLRSTTRYAVGTRGADGVHGGSSWRLREQGVKVAEILVQFLQPARIDAGSGSFNGQSELRLSMLELTFKDLTGAGDGVSLAVEKAFDAQGHFDVAAAVETLAGAAFVRFELREFALPEAEDVGGNVAEFGDFADAKVELVRNVGSGGWGGFADWLMLRHARKLREPPFGGGGLWSGCCQYRPLAMARFVIFPGWDC